MCTCEHLTVFHYRFSLLCMTNTEVKLRQGRHLVLLDIENLAGTATPSPFEIAATIAELRQAVPGFDSAQRVWACSHRAARTVAFAAMPDRQLWNSGPDGADRALLEVLDTEDIEQRYERVTVCSGDGILAESVARLAGQGVVLGVAGLHGRVSARLRLAAHTVVYLRGTHSVLGTAS